MRREARSRPRGQLPQVRPPVGPRRPAGGRRGAQSRSAGTGFGRRWQSRTGGGRIHRRPAAAFVAGTVGDLPARLPRIQITRADPAHGRVSRAPRSRATSWSASPSWRHGSAYRCGSSHSRCAGAPCTRRKSACTPRTRCFRPGRRRLEKRWPKLKSDGVVGDDVELQVVTGNGWDQALDAAEWHDGEVLASAHHRKARSRGSSWARRAPRSSGTARCPYWCCRTSTSPYRGRRRSGCPRSSPTRRSPTTRPRPKPLRPS